MKDWGVAYESSSGWSNNDCESTGEERWIKCGELEVERAEY